MEAAKERIPNIPLLINIVARRVRQLNRGERPLVRPDDSRMSHMDLALKEIGEGKLTAEMKFKAPADAPAHDNVISL